MSFDFSTQVDRRGYPGVKWHRYPQDVLPLWVADMDFRSPPVVLEALQQRVGHGVFGYGGPDVRLNRTLCDWSREHYDWDIEPAWQQWIPGVVPALHMAALAFSEPGQGVLTATPIYPPFLQVAAHTGRELQTFALAEPATPGAPWRFDAQAMEAAIRPNTRVLLWCHPHNPTGRVWTVEELGALAKLARRHDLIVVSDELHCDLVLDPGRRHHPLGRQHPFLAERLVTLWAPSKTFNTAGLSAACAIIADTGLRRRFHEAIEGMLPHANVLGLAAAGAAYGGGEAWRQQLLAVLRDNLALVEQYVARWPGVHLSRPEATYLAWLDMRSSRVAEAPARQLLEQARVALSDGADYACAGFARLNFGTPRAWLDEALQRMDAVLAV